MKQIDSDENEVQQPQEPASSPGSDDAGAKVERPKPSQSKVKKVAPNTVHVTTSQSLDEMLADVCTPTGTRHDEIAIRVIEQVATSLVRPKPGDNDQSLIVAISTIAGIAPQDPIEAMLATQLIATHEAALFFMASATRDEQTFEGRDANVLRATRLMRVHLDQIEALQKLRGKSGQQKVTVEHVHVHDGGQAIVGAVSASNADRGGGKSHD